MGRWRKVEPYDFTAFLLQGVAEQHVDSELVPGFGWADVILHLSVVYYLKQYKPRFVGSLS